MVSQTGWSHFLTRLPPEIKNWIESEAARNGSSQNSEIVRALVERKEKMTTGQTLAGNTPSSSESNAALPGGHSRHDG